MSTLGPALAAGLAALALAPATLAAQAQPPTAAIPIAAIPGVVAAGARLERVVATVQGMDGIVASPDGGVLYAQEHTDTVRKVDPAGRDTAFVADTHGAGSLGMDTRGRVYAVQRTCTDPGVKRETPCAEPTMVGVLAPERRTLASRFADGKPFGRPADLVVDAAGGAYFTMGGVYYVSPAGAVSTVADQDIRSNGLALSPDGRTLYVTNATEVVAFDVQADGSARNRRVFAVLGDTNADGMAVDAAGRLYATAAKGIYVFAADGARLGLIPTAHRPTSVAFSGPGKRTLYVILGAAVGADGQVMAAPETSPNGGRTLYRLELQTPGFAGRPK